jgi:hypothetical protein
MSDDDQQPLSPPPPPARRADDENDVDRDGVEDSGDFDTEPTWFQLRDYATERAWNPNEEKSRGGTWVAKAIVVTFAASVVLWFGLIFSLLFVCRGAQDIDKIAATFGTLLKDYATFAGVFSPLLAFVLGYYFGEKKES